MSKSDKHAGGCACGAVRFEVSGEPRFVANCHCADCRKQTSSAFATYVGVKTDQMKFNSGKAREHASSAEARRGFCGDCGAPLYFRSENWPGEIHFFLFTFDDPEAFTPTAHVQLQESPEWLHLADDMVKRQGF